MPIRVGVEVAPVKGHAGASRRVEVFCGAGEQVLRWLSFAALTRMAYELGDSPGVRRASPPAHTAGPPRASRTFCSQAPLPCPTPQRGQSRAATCGRGCPGAGHRGRRSQRRGSYTRRSRHPPAVAGGGAPWSPDPTAALSAARRGPAKG